MVESKLRMPPALWIGKGLQILCCLVLVLTLGACSDTPSGPPTTPLAVTPGVPLFRFPNSVGTIIEYQYSYIVGAAFWGTMVSRSESHGTRVWTVTASSGDTVSGSITVRVTGTDSVIAQGNSSDMIHPAPIDTSVVAIAPSTFTVTFTQDSMMVGFAAIMQTVNNVHGKFSRKLSHALDTLTTGTETFYAGLAVYKDGSGVKSYRYMHTSQFYERGEQLILTSVHKPG